MIAHFGLGANAVVDSVIIDWTGGKQQIITQVGVNQQLMIIESNAPTKDQPYFWYFLGAILVLPMAYFLYRKRRLAKK